MSQFTLMQQKSIKGILFYNSTTKVKVFLFAIPHVQTCAY